jgi:2-polyprenyl-3-methyl-5-hydroxy-6-metoxy-1,4-benzoquinol methylase
MILITEDYKALNTQLHNTHKRYGVGGKKHYDKVKELFLKYECKDILDYGCGKATLSEKIACTNYDPCIPKYSQLPKSHDLLVCTDVLEHIEPDLLASVLNHIWSLINKVGYLVIATRFDSSKTLPDGSNPHKIVKAPKWWKNELMRYFTIISIDQVRNSEVIFEVIP